MNHVLCPSHMQVELFLHCTLSIEAQCIVIVLYVAEGQVDGRRAVFVVGGQSVSVTTITRNCMHQTSPNWVCRCR